MLLRVSIAQFLTSDQAGWAYLNKTLAHINKMQQKFSAETAPNLSHDDNGRNDTTARAVRNRQNLNGLKKVTFGNIDRA
jgi:hypothetical protein